MPPVTPPAVPPRTPPPPVGPGGPPAPVTAQPATGAPATAPTGRACPACGAVVADDQRYCLECGERQIARSDFLLAGGAGAAQGAAMSGGVPPAAGAPTESGDERRRGAWLLLGLVGLLLLAMGVGVLIGKAGKTPTLPTKVVQVSGSGAATQTSGETGFTSSWPSGKTGFTVELKTLPSGTSVATITAAKNGASAKGASGVGALKAEEFSSLGGSEYVIYSGQYASRAAAAAALSSLKGKFAGAKVIEVSNNAGGGSEPPSAAEKAAKPGEAITKPAPLTKKKSSHTSYKQESEELPDVVETK